MVAKYVSNSTIWSGTVQSGYDDSEELRQERKQIREVVEVVPLMWREVKDVI